MWISREKTFRRYFQVGEVAAPAPRYEYLCARLPRVVDQQYSPAALSCRYRAHQSRRAGSYDYDVECFHRRSHYDPRSPLAQVIIELHGDRVNSASEIDTLAC